MDLYAGKVARARDDAMRFMRSVDAERGLRTLLAAYRFLAEDARVKAARRASIGWCFGGGWSLRLALNAPDLDACVIHYGRLVADPERLRAIGKKTRLLGIFGNRDRGIPPAVVDRFEAALAKAGRRFSIHRYDANHAFANPSSARYDQKAAGAAWKKVRAFLDETLRKPAR